MSAVNIIIAILMFSFVVIFHEFGHFLLARVNGIKVNDFSLGMGPRLFGFKAYGTKFSVRLFPIGGSCAMEGEIEDSKDEHAFTNKKIWQRFLVIFAGPFFNFILAFIGSVVMIAMAGYDRPYITDVTKGSAAETAGLEAGDLITRIDGEKINFGREIMVRYTYSPIEDATPVKITYIREGKSRTVSLIPQYKAAYYLGFGYTADDSAAVITSVTDGYPFDDAGIVTDDVITGIDGVKIPSGAALQEYLLANPLGVNAINITYTHNNVEKTVTISPKENDTWSMGFSYNVYDEKADSVIDVVKYSGCEVKYWIVTTVKGLGQLISGKVSRNDLGGPVRIVSEISNVVDESEQYGAETVILNIINWIVLLSANLGVMNLLPIPALDGGRILFLIIEAIRRKPFNREKEAVVDGIFFALLMVLMVFIFYNDIYNLIH